MPGAVTAAVRVPSAATEAPQPPEVHRAGHTGRKTRDGPWIPQRGAIRRPDPTESGAGGCGMRSRRCSPGPFCPFLATVSPAHGGGAPATRKGPTGTTWCGTTCWQRHGVGAQEVQGTGEAGGSRGAGETPALKGSAIGLMAPSPSPHVSSTGGGRERRAEQ